MPVFGTYPVPPGGNDDFIPGTVISSSEVDGNFDAISLYLNSQFVDDDVIADASISGSKLIDATVDGSKLIPGTVPAGSVAPGSITSVEIADGTIVNDDISPTADIDGSKILDNSIGLPKLSFPIAGSGSTPIGTINMFAGPSAPAEWLLCDGSEVSRATYAALFSVISTIYGIGDGATTFNLPDLRSRMMVGTGTNNIHADNEGLAENLRDSPAHVHGLSGGVDPAPDHQHTPGTLSVNISGTTGDANNEGLANSHHQGFILNASGASKISGNHGIGPSDFAPAGGGSGDNFTKLSHGHNFSDSSPVTGVTSLGGAHGHTDTFSVDPAEPPYIVLTPIIYTGV